MKQTAVEWLVNEMIQRKFFEKETELSYTTLEHLTNQAKEMENQQQEGYVITKESWDAADKITHDGFIYVKFNDLNTM